MFLVVKFCHHPNEVRTSASGVAHAKFLLSSKLSVTFSGRMTMAAMRMPVARSDKANLIQACRLMSPTILRKPGRRQTPLVNITPVKELILRASMQ